MKVIQIPFDKGGLPQTGGCKDAPSAIVSKLGFSSEVIDVDNENASDAFKVIEEKLSGMSDTCILGGDHSITYATFKAFVKNNPGAGLLVFDAHADCMQSSFDVPTHEDYLRKLIDEGTLDVDKVIIVGLREIDPSEEKFLREKKIDTYPMKDLFGDVEQSCDSIMETIRSWPACYLSIDIDVIDPAFAPGTGHPEPGGLSSAEFFYFLRRLKRLENIRMVDLVEVNPKKDVNGATIALAAKIVKFV